MTLDHPVSKDQQIQNIFDRIAGRYDFLNRVISFHLDTVWRKKAIKMLSLRDGEKIVLDLGCGTGDLALTAAKEIDKIKVIGLDFSLAMLRLAQAKKKRAHSGESVTYILGSALAPPFQDDAFDAVMTAFVLRNISDLSRFFERAYRLLKPGGKIVSLDIFPPSAFPFSFLYALYFYRLVPWIGAGLAGERNAYQHLSDSVRTFSPPQSIAELILRIGFQKVKIQKFLCGAVCLHTGEKPGKAAEQA